MTDTPCQSTLEVHCALYQYVTLLQRGPVQGLALNVLKRKSYSLSEE